MMMEIFLNRDKAKFHNYSIEKCYELLDQHFSNYNVKKISTGIYFGTDTDFTAFAIAATRLPKTDWFLKIVDEWYWRADSDKIEDRDDCLKEYYELRALGVS